MRGIAVILSVCLVVNAVSRADNATQLTSGPGWNYFPRWLPDGQTISFTSQRTGTPGIWMIPAAGGEAVPLPTGKTGDHHATWSPDCKTVIFDAYFEEVLEIWSMPAEGGTPTRLTFNTYGDTAPNWNARLNRIAYSGWTGVRTMNPDGSDIRQITTNGGHACWSPDGSRVAYSSEISGNSDVWIAPVDGGSPTQFTSYSGFDEHAYWSPDGRWIVFTSERSGNWDLWIAPVDDASAAVQITDHPANDWYACFSPDQTKIVFTSNRAGSLDLWMIDSGLPEYKPGFHDSWAWETYEPEDHGVGTRLRGYWGAAFDGRYIYYAPGRDGIRPHGKVLRYDTRGDFDDASAWLMFNPYANGVGDNPRGFAGAVCDGRYVYFVPNANNEGSHAEVLRYDTQAAFDTAAAWVTFDPSEHGVGAVLGGYMGGIFDGRYIYFVPNFHTTYDHGEVLRYDTQGAFEDAASWTSFDPGNAGVGVDPDGYLGGTFDGRYVYFSPLQNGSEWHSEVLRLDTTGEFADTASWTTFDPGDAGVGLHAGGYGGAVFDGHYVYFVPFHSGDTHHGEVLRYDSTLPFGNVASWNAFDAGDAGLGDDPDGYIGGVYDGRYVYFVPDYDGDGFHGEVLRCDTRGDFSDMSSWATFDPQDHGLCENEPSYIEAVFDGRYIYFCPNHDESQHGEFLRYDTAAVCFGDLDRDGTVGIADLATLLGSYGEEGVKTYLDGDLDGDGQVSLPDLATLLGVYGKSCRG